MFTQIVQTTRLRLWCMCTGNRTLCEICEAREQKPRKQKHHIVSEEDAQTGEAHGI